MGTTRSILPGRVFLRMSRGHFRGDDSDQERRSADPVTHRHQGRSWQDVEGGLCQDMPRLAAFWLAIGTLCAGRSIVVLPLCINRRLQDEDDLEITF